MATEIRGKTKNPAPRHALRTAGDPADENVVVVGLTAAIVTTVDEGPAVLVIEQPKPKAPSEDLARFGLPFGPFDPKAHRTLDAGLRGWVEEQTFLELGYVEQLYTFGDRGRHDQDALSRMRVVSVGYLALTRQSVDPRAIGARWQSWYVHFPWEDWRGGRPAIVDAAIAPALDRWLEAGDPRLREARRARLRQCFGFYKGPRWDEERVLERYELLYEAGIVYESVRDRGSANGKPLYRDLPPTGFGAPMIYDHRRILATAMGRLRGKLKYRPVIFELMPPSFTLSDLQRTVEAISGIKLHKQNFRRLIEAGGLVEETGELSSLTGGRPAKLFRFRREVVSERPAPGVKLSGAAGQRR